MKITFSVEDTGIGIKEEDHDKLFKIFGKLEQAESVNPTGIGLGLTICSKILNEMGGELSVRSALGQGSQFYFTINM
jgi:signal transduction histidine kinase